MANIPEGKMAADVNAGRQVALNCPLNPNESTSFESPIRHFKSLFRLCFVVLLFCFFFVAVIFFFLPLDTPIMAIVFCFCTRRPPPLRFVLSFFLSSVIFVLTMERAMRKCSSVSLRFRLIHSGTIARITIRFNSGSNR